MLANTGDCPYKCPTCKKMFVQQKHLEVHKLMGNGKLPQKCNVHDEELSCDGNVKH